MDVKTLAISDIKILTPKRFGDARGWFSEVFNAQTLKAAGIDFPVVQENTSFSAEVGTLRGLHFQTPPKAQGKLVRVLKGRIWDVAVDIREGSPSFGKWVGHEISADAGNQILVPVGFAHGFVTLEPQTLVGYLLSEHYSPVHDAGISWNDPDLAIDWPEAAKTPILSAKDQIAPRLKDIVPPFSLVPA